MSINIFALESCQLLVWIALALIALLGILHFFYEGDIFDSYDPCGSSYFSPSEKKWKKWLYWIVLAAVAVLWLVVVIANHQTFWNDVINLVFLAGFSVVCAALFYCVAMFIMIIVFIVIVGRNRGTISDIID